MFTNTEAFSGFSVDDLEAAKKFYGETLGIRINRAYCEVVAAGLSRSTHPLFWTARTRSTSTVNCACRSLLAVFGSTAPMRRSSWSAVAA
jgi:extradiol dioxygenase family protein